MTGEILSFSENQDIAGELSAAAFELSSAMGKESLSIEVDELRSPDDTHGKVILLRAAQPIHDNPELIARGIAQEAKKRVASVVLVGATRIGREIASRIAVQLRIGCLTDVKRLRVENGRLLGNRNVYAGKFLANVASSMPCVALLQAGAHAKKTGGTPSIEVVNLERIDVKVKLIEVRPKPKATVDLKSASVIVSAGRGIKKKEDLAIIEQLASEMSGVVGCSRPLSSDLGWLGEEHHIGLTGVYVHPDLYVAVGISGQLQHIAGIKESKVIVAINKDKQAPIFQVADYGVVGDLYQIVPALLRVLGTKSSS